MRVRAARPAQVRWPPSCAYTQLLVRTCHRRGAHAIGGMSAFISTGAPDVTANALARVREDKERDGRWPTARGRASIRVGGWTSTARSATAEPEGPAARGRRRERELLTCVLGRDQRAGMRQNVARACTWIAGCATARRRLRPHGRCRNGGFTARSSGSGGRRGATTTGGADGALFATLRDEELAKLGGRDAGRSAEATELLDRLVLSDDFPDFLTLEAYARLD